MMKPLLTLVFCLGMMIPLQAQIELGLLGGISRADANLEIQNLNLGEIQNIQGTRFAGVIHLRSNKRISLQSELALSQRGFAFHTDSLTVRNLVSSYLELPMLLRLNLKLGKLRVHVGGGASGGLWMQAQQFDEIRGQADPQQALDFVDSFQRLEVSLNGVAGIGLKLGPGWLELAARSSLGLTDIFADGPNPIFNGLNSSELIINNARNNVSMVSLSYMIPLFGRDG